MQKRILICPLDWGLGHATRCIPIIRLLIKNNAEVLIASDDRALELLKNEFPQLNFIRLKGYNIKYSASSSMVIKMLFSIPKILLGIYSEHKALKRILQKEKIDIVISDNRFGLWNKKVKTIFITHQLMIKSPFAEELIHKLNLYFIKKYDECWIPDIESENNLSGDLSHFYPLPKNASFIGILSRFENKQSIEEFEFDVIVIVSGPEPQRSIFEKLITDELHNLKIKSLIVCGKTETQKTITQNENITMVNHLNAQQMQKAISNSKFVIARSGYSTIMDLATLGKRAIFIPTPGQTEQEYLAEKLMQSKIAFYQNQSSLNLKEAFVKSEKYFGFTNEYSTNKLELQIKKIVS